MTPTAVLSDDGIYRYRLGRRWGDGPALVFVMLNPSTADAMQDDPTIRRCVGFAKRDGYPAIDVVNLFAFRATEPLRVRQAHGRGVDIVGPDNDDHIIVAVSEAARVVFAWGGFVTSLPGWRERVSEVYRIVLSREQSVASALGHTTHGHPRHPLYVRASAPFVYAVLTGGES